MSQIDDGILYLCKEDVEMACQQIDSVAVIREAFRLHALGQMILPDEAYLSWTNAQGEQVRNLNMPGYLGGSLNVAGTKIINGNIHNPRRGLPRASGLTMLYDDTSVRIVCIMEGASISSLRTASVTALSMDMLQCSYVECVAVIGAGVLAQAHIELLIRRFPQVRRVRIFDLDMARIQSLQNVLAPALKEHATELQITSSAEEAIRAAQVIIPVTTTTAGYIQWSWLQPGALLVNVSLDDPLPEVVLNADCIIVDDWNLVKNDPRRLIGRMYRQGLVVGPDASDIEVQRGQRHIDAQIGEIVAGKKVGRTSEKDIILVNPFGLAIEDVALAAHIYQIAQSRGYGTWLKR